MLYDNSNPYQYVRRRKMYDPGLNYGTAQTGQNRGTKGGIEETTSNIGTGIASAFPMANMFMQVGKAGYSGFKGMDNEVGDGVSTVFGPHHSTFGLWDDAIQSGKSGGDGKVGENVGLGFASLDPATNIILSIARGRQKRAAEANARQLRSTMDNPYLYAFDDKGLHYNNQVDIVEEPNNVNAKSIAGATALGSGIGAGIKALTGLNKGDNQTGQTPVFANPTAPQQMDGTQTVDTNGGGFDWSMWSDNTTVDENGIQPVTYGFRHGGPAMVHGGKGKDDIALVDTNTGKDTGVRVSKGEMLVVSDETLDALGKAIKKKDKNAVFKLMHDQVNQTPETNGGQKGFQNGGPVDVEKELAAIDNRIKEIESGKSTAAEQKRVSQLKSQYDELVAQYRKIGEEGKRKPYTQSLFGIPLTWEARSEEGTLNRQKATLEKIRKLGAELNQSEIPTVTESELVEPAPVAPVVLGAGKRSGPSTASLSNKYLKAARSTDYSNAADPFADMHMVYNPAEGESALPVEPAMDFNLQDSIYDAQAGEYDMEAGANPNRGFDWRNALGYGLDAARFGIGIAGTDTEIPEFRKSRAWNDYVGQSEYLAQQGLTPEEMALANDNINSTYAADVKNIYNLAGGNSGIALGNLGRAAMGRYRAGVNLAALDRQARNTNRAAYGNILANDVNLDRLIFSDRYNQANATKQAAAQLANDAFWNTQDRMNTDEMYGRGTLYDQLMKENLAATEETRGYNRDYMNYLRRNQDRLFAYNP